MNETHIDGLEKKKHLNKKLRARRGAVGKAIVVGARDRATKRVSAKVVEATDVGTLQGFIVDHAAEDMTVCTDEYGTNRDLPLDHKTVKNSVGEYVNEAALTNGIESFWALLKCSYYGHVSSCEQEVSLLLCAGIIEVSQHPRLEYHCTDVSAGTRYDSRSDSSIMSWSHE